MKEIGKFNVVTNNKPDETKVNQVVALKDKLVRTYMKVESKMLRTNIDEYASYLVIYADDKKADSAKKILDFLVELHNDEHPENKMENLTNKTNNYISTL